MMSQQNFPNSSNLRNDKSEKIVTAKADEIAYEIRSSLEIILGFAAVLKEPGISTTDTHRFLEIIERNANTIAKLVVPNAYK